jgi:hypothetical protein
LQFRPEDGTKEGALEALTNERREKKINIQRRKSGIVTGVILSPLAYRLLPWVILLVTYILSHLTLPWVMLLATCKHVALGDMLA